MIRKVTRVEHGRSNSRLAMPYTLAWMECGHAKGIGAFNAGHVVVTETEFDCETCGDVPAKVERLKGLLGKIHHTRFRNGTIYAYRLDPTSPSGFMLEAGFPAIPEIDAVLKGGLAPLSPTEKA